MNKTKEAALAALHKLLFQINNPDRPVIVGIDFEGFDIIINRTQPAHAGNRGTQAGVSVLDTARIAEGFKTFNFVEGDQQYFDKALMTFQFGMSQKVQRQDMSNNIKNCLRRFQGRNFVLVGHSPAQDLMALTALGFFDGSMNITETFDTYFLAKALRIGNSYRLNRLLASLGCPIGEAGCFHNAGCDANYTLRLLLLLGVNSVAETRCAKLEYRAELLHRIATRDLKLDWKWQQNMGEQWSANYALTTRRRLARQKTPAQKEERRKAREEETSIDGLIDILFGETEIWNNATNITNSRNEPIS